MTIKLALNIAGSVLAAVGIYFVAISIVKLSDQIEFTQLPSIVWFMSFLFAIVYGVSNFLLALAFHQLLKHNGGQPQTRRIIRLYGISQLAKYVPGNVIQIASRHAMGVANNLDNRVLAKAAFHEILLLALAAAVFFPFALPVVFSEIPLVLTVGIFLVTVIALPMIAKLIMSRQFMRAGILYLVFFAIMGGIFAGLVMVISDKQLSSVQAIATGGAFVVAWLAGFVTPGAPAGVGIREAVLLLLLGGFVSESTLLLAVIVARLITVSGDVLTYILCQFIPTSKLSNTQAS